MKEQYSEEELKELTKKVPLHAILNKKGVVYKERQEELEKLSEDELIREMAKDPRLVRRPIIITDDKVIVGFDESQYEELLK